MDIERFSRLQKEVKKAQRTHDEASGALTELLKQLKKEHQCDNYKEGVALLKELKIKKHKALKTYEKELAKFEEKWDDRLEENQTRSDKR